MKKSKIIFAIIAGIILAVCITGTLFSNQEEPPATESTEPTVTEPTTEATETTATKPTEAYVPEPLPEFTELDPVQLAENVTMNQVELEGEIIRNYLIDESHPEYIDTQGGDPYACSEGIIFRNDRTLTIDLLDQMSGRTFSITFGYITGQCNRFLYLNPFCAVDGEILEDAAFNYQFDYPIGGGNVLNLSDSSKEYEEHTSFSVGRALEEWENASYVAPNKPGTVWHAGPAIEGPIYIDCRVFTLRGDMIAILRLTIDRLSDGTYAMVNLEDKNLLTNPSDSDIFTPSELAYIVNFADQTFHDPDQVGFHSTTNEKIQFSMEECMIEYLEAGEPLYYNQFIPKDGNNLTRPYAEMNIPIVAVTYRAYGTCSQTFYFQQYLPPFNGEYGIYNYIGRDFPVFDTVQRLIEYGYTGNG